MAVRQHPTEGGATILKKTIMAALCAGLLLFALLGPSGCSRGKPGTMDAFQPVRLKLGTETALDTPETRGSQRLAELVKERSKGTLSIEVFENAKLGTMKERDERMRLGTVDMGTSSVGFLASYVPLLGIFDLPYLYADKEHELRVFDGEIGAAVDKKLQAQGLRVVCYFDAGTRQITNNRRPIHRPADLRGLRIRVPQTEASVEGFKALGAIPTAMAFGEVYVALKQNVVEGQENPIALVLYNRFHEVQKYLSLTNHQYFIQVLTISEKTWRNLSPQHQNVLRECAKEAQAYQRVLAAEEERNLLRVLQDKGIVINEVKNMAEFSRLAQPLRNVYIRKLGQPARELLEKIDALRH